MCQIENWRKPPDNGGEEDDEGQVTFMLGCAYFVPVTAFTQICDLIVTKCCLGLEKLSTCPRSHRSSGSQTPSWICLTSKHSCFYPQCSQQPTAEHVTSSLHWNSYKLQYLEADHSDCESRKDIFFEPHSAEVALPTSLSLTLGLNSYIFIQRKHCWEFKGRKKTDKACLLRGAVHLTK